MNIQISLSKVEFTQEKIKDILTTYDQDNIFDIDKEVDAHINRVEKRLERKV